jgi:acetyl-CoA synthetase
MESFKFGGEIVWRPTKAAVERSRIKHLMDRHGIATFEEFHHRSITDLEWFWRAVLQELAIEFFQPYERLLDTTQGVAWTRWCVGGKMNIVHNCLDKWMGTPVENRVAIRWEGEEGVTRSVTYRELFQNVNRLANALRRTACAREMSSLCSCRWCRKMPRRFRRCQDWRHCPAALLRLCAGAVAARLSDAGAKVLLTADGFYRRGETVALNRSPTKRCSKRLVWSMRWCCAGPAKPFRGVPGAISTGATPSARNHRMPQRREPTRKIR